MTKKKWMDTSEDYNPNFYKDLYKEFQQVRKIESDSLNNNALKIKEKVTYSINNCRWIIFQAKKYNTSIVGTFSTRKQWHASQNPVMKGELPFYILGTNYKIFKIFDYSQTVEYSEYKKNVA